MNKIQIQKFLYIRTDADLIRLAERKVGNLNLTIAEAIECLKNILPSVALPFDGFAG